MIEKKKSLVKKILLMLMIILAFILVNSSDSQAFTMGKFDFKGGEGLTAGPQPYLFGEYYCINHALPLTRTLDGTKASEIVVYNNRNNGGYYNQEIDYDLSNTFEVEQSIAAGYLAYLLNTGSKVQFQNVVWSSAQWQNKTGYVNNLAYYTGTTVSGTANSEQLLYERAEAWANFYYNILVPSGMQLNISTMPTSEEDMRVYVDQTARTYTQGPYMISILNSSGADISSTATEYHYAGTLGNLLYQEIAGLNAGSGVFQFAKLNSLTATVSFTDGSSEDYSTNITILDANGGVLPFPKPGEIFYIRIEVPEGESRTVERIEPNFNVQYLTEIPGSTYRYDATTIRFELYKENNQKWLDTYAASTDRNIATITMNTIKEILEEHPEVVDTDSVKQYLIDTIIEKAAEDGFNITNVEFQEFSLDNFIVDWKRIF